MSPLHPDCMFVDERLAEIGKILAPADYYVRQY
jgi:hypothetical protein